MQLTAAVHRVLIPAAVTVTVRDDGAHLHTIPLSLVLALPRVARERPVVVVVMVVMLVRRASPAVESRRVQVAVVFVVLRHDDGDREEASGPGRREVARVRAWRGGGQLWGLQPQRDEAPRRRLCPGMF